MQTKEQLISKIERYRAAEFKLWCSATSMSHYPWTEQITSKVLDLNSKASGVHGMVTQYINDLKNGYYAS